MGWLGPTSRWRARGIVGDAGTEWDLRGGFVGPFSFETSLTVCPIVLDTDAALELPEVAAVDVDADAGADADGVNNSLKASGMLPETKSANSGAGVVDRVCSCGGSR